MRVYISEVSPRDGFQNEKVFIESEHKIAFINQLSQCGYHKIEVTSFTSPKAIPALKDAEYVMHNIHRNPDVIYSALVPNLRGAERALSCQVDEINLVMSCSETHNQSNLRMSREQSQEQLKAIIQEVNQQCQINLSLSTAFGCPMQGDVPFLDVINLAQYFADLGINKITLCDTTGMAYPSQVKALFQEIQTAITCIEWTAHFHNTRGLALANTLAALESDITHFDASLGGIGGCPYAPGASGNTSTEDLVHMLELMHLETGINLEKIMATSRQLPTLIGHPTDSQIIKAGTRLTLHPAPVQ